ncbi:MAG: endonuclease/exonuclease/phosphatase family protein [Bacteroidales bacterium]|nr:endonuclease/exonuclease/phosphatase family protein [Bacteroides sp.]MCM1198935.1 endonuclease/exonuclease/phosphatase family protein [Clostridium sp.]MCM1502527.1 endonuclease/exonuclease/phosphatase family protein [Bacteroidales bacterium]
MRRTLLTTVMILTGCLCLAQTFTLRVMSMNIKEGGKYIDNASEPYSELINKYRPDVVALQEVDYKTVRNGNRDWLNEVAAQTGMFPYYCQSFSYQGGGFGVALLSRYPFYKAEKIVSVIEGAREHRASGWIYISLPNGENVRVASVHLALESSQITIRHMADLNKKIFENDTVTPALLIGDYNSAPESDAIAYIKVKWQDISKDTGPTIPSDAPKTKLDYVMGYPKTWTMDFYEIVARPDLSDHCFVVADVSFIRN